jgi:hypothetical protein
MESMADLSCTASSPYAVRWIAALEAKRFEFVGLGTEDEQMMITPLMPERP